MLKLLAKQITKHNPGLNTMQERYIGEEYLHSATGRGFATSPVVDDGSVQDESPLFSRNTPRKVLLLMLVLCVLVAPVRALYIVQDTGINTNQCRFVVNMLDLPDTVRSVTCSRALIARVYTEHNDIHIGAFIGFNTDELLIYGFHEKAHVLGMNETEAEQYSLAKVNTEYVQRLISLYYWVYGGK